MKKDNITSYETSGDVTAIAIDIMDADIEIRGTAENKFIVQRLLHSHIRVTEHEGTVRLKQIAKPFFHRARLRIWIPAHTAPDIALNAKRCTLMMSGPVCGELIAKCGEAEINLNNCFLKSADIGSSALKLTANGLSVKEILNVNSAAAEVLLENSLCRDIDMDCNKGNYGLPSLTCSNAVLRLDRGSVNLILCGGEDEYGTSLTVKEGTCNRESSPIGEKLVKVYVETGNIAVDFTEKKEDGYEDDDVAEDSGGARGR